MEALLPFLKEHSILTGLFTVLVLLLLINEWRGRRFGMRRLTPQAAIELINHHSAVVFDLRNESQFHNGHLTNAHNLPSSELASKLKKMNRYKSKPILLVCSQGQDAPKVAALLQQEGYEHLYVLAGGISAWKGEGLPLVK